MCECPHVGMQDSLDLPTMQVSCQVDGAESSLFLTMRLNSMVQGQSLNNKMTLTIDDLQVVARHVRIDTLNAVLEKVTQLQAAGRDIDELAWWLKGALGWELDGAAGYRLRVWRSPSPHRGSRVSLRPSEQPVPPSL